MKCCVGIDLTDTFVMVSYMRENMKKPETVSMVAGSEKYQIPLAVGYLQEKKQWVYGEDALRLKTGQVAEHLLSRTLSEEKVSLGEEQYEALELFALFLKKILSLPGKMGEPVSMERVVLTLDQVNKKMVTKLGWVMTKLGIPSGKWSVLDYKESFYYYALSQPKELWVHDVVLYRLGGDGTLYFWCLQRNQKTTPQLATVVEKNLGVLGEDKDHSFEKSILQSFEKRIVTTVYLVGAGFDGGWMKQSLWQLCKNRKAFMGKNLFSLGACFQAYYRLTQMEWPIVYLGEHEMKINIGICVRSADGDAMYTLISAGTNWYEAKGSCEVILDGAPEVDFFLQPSQSRVAEKRILKLDDAPKRPNRTTRLSIFAEAVSDHAVNVTVEDMGFGELFVGTQKQWTSVFEL